MTSDETSSTTRRRLIRTGVAAGAGIGVAAVVATPASAAAGDAVIVGTTNDAGPTETVLVGGTADKPTLALESGPRPPLVLVPVIEQYIAQELPTGSLAVSLEGDMVFGGKAGTKTYVNSSRWANRTLAVPPQRILDTRSLATYAGNIVSATSVVTSGKLNAGKTIHLTVKNVPPAVAEKATSAYVNITVANTVSAGVLTAWSSSYAKPVTSSLNWWGPNQILSNLVEVKLGWYTSNSVSFAIHVSAAASVIVDVSGLILSAPATY